MSRLLVFGDEAGDFAFVNGPQASKYYIICTVTMESCKVGEALLELRRDMAWRNVRLGEYFHATTDMQVVRDEVFALLCRHDFQVQATVMQKAKAQPQVRSSDARFYQYGWHFHLQKQLGPRIRSDREVMITVASVGTKKRQIVFTEAVNDVVRQRLRREQWRTAFWPCKTDPCLQVADYCTWAIQRKWESPNRADVRSYNLIKDRITKEYDVWQYGQVLYY